MKQQKVRRPKINYRETSGAAWRRFKSVSAVLDRQILAALELYPDGLADFEIEAVIGRAHQAVSGNRCWLVKDGLVEDTGRKRLKNNRNWCHVWALSPLAKGGGRSK